MSRPLNPARAILRSFFTDLDSFPVPVCAIVESYMEVFIVGRARSERIKLQDVKNSFPIALCLHETRAFVSRWGEPHGVDIYERASDNCDTVDWKFKGTIGKSGQSGTSSKGNGEVAHLREMAVIEGELYVCETTHEIFSLDGVYRRQIGPLRGWVMGIAWDPSVDELYIAADEPSSTVEVFDRKSLKLLRSWGGYSGGSPLKQPLGCLSQPRSIAVDWNRDRIYVSEVNTCRVQVFNRRGKVIRVLDGMKDGSTPEPLAPNSEVQVIRADFRQPTGLSISSSQLFVADCNNCRVQIFDLDTFELQAIVGSKDKLEIGYPAFVLFAGDALLAMSRNEIIILD